MAAVVQPQAPDAMAWRRDSFSGPADYTVVLNDADRAQIRATLSALAASGRLVEPTHLARADFAWGELGTRLAQAFDQVRAGRGFALIRGLPTEDLDLQPFIAAVWGSAPISAHPCRKTPTAN